MNGTLRTTLIVIVAVVAIPLLWGGMMMSGVASGMMGGAGPSMMGGWAGGWEGGWGSGWGLLMMVPGLLIFAAIVAALVWGLGRASSTSSGGAGARDILDARYARGEITREQYHQMRGDLRG